MSSSKKKQLRKEQYMTERQNAAAKEAKQLTSSDEDVNSLMVELIASHTLG